MTYRDRRLAKAEKLRDWADGHEAKADADEATSRQISDMIPFGQPILVGHHSEGRHRRDLARIESGYRAAIEHGRTADNYRSRADGIEAAAAGAIYSDDPDAVDQLQARIAELEAERDRIKAYNKTVRAGRPDTSLLDAKQRADLASVLRVAAYQAPGGKFPAYALTNLSGNINRNKKRLEQLATAAVQPERLVRQFPARYAGSCAECGEAIEVGDAIGKTSKGRIVHVMCSTY